MIKLGIRALLVLLSVSAGSGVWAQDRQKSVDSSRLFKGTWLEIARRPMWITDGCVAGTTSYVRGASSNEVHVRDACRKGKEETVLNGVAEILDPGVNSRLLVRYNPLLSVEYDIIDHSADYSWFIEASPTLDNVFIFTRARPSEKQLAALLNRVRLLGYDTSSLEFPWGR